MSTGSITSAAALDDRFVLGGVFDAAVTGLAVLDLDGRFTWVNRALCDLLGRDSDQLLGLRVIDITHPDDQATSQATIDELATEPWRTNRVRKRYLRPDGTVVVADRTVTALRDRSGAMTGMLSQIFDATELSDAQEAVRSSERRFRALVAKSWDVITLHGPDGRYLYVSPAVTDVFGVAPEALIGVDPFTFIEDPDGRVREVFFGAPTDGQTSGAVEYRVRHQDGKPRWVESVCRNLVGDPAVGGFVVTSRDVTARRRRNAQQDAVAALSRAGLGTSDLDTFLGRVMATVSEVLDIAHCSVLDVRAGGWLAVRRRSGPPLVERPFRLQVGGCPTTRSAQAFLERRSVRWSEDDALDEQLEELRASELRSGLATVIYDTEPWGVLVVRSAGAGSFSDEDVSFLESVANVIGAAVGRRRVEEELRQRACTDALTGLPNRPGLVDRLRTALRRLQDRQGSVAVLFVDTDDLKLINDSMGHAAGDAVIAAVGARIVGALRQGDIVARFGGDEFVVLCEQCDPDEAERIAERVRTSLTEPVQLPDRTVTVTASIGIAVATEVPQGEDGVDVRADDLLAAADTAMYQAKVTGKDRSAVFGQGMRQEVNERLEIIDGLRRALRDERLQMHFQPIVDVRTGTVVAAEALVRWPDGPVGPDRFIAIAEDSGLIHPLGQWVLETTLRQVAAWQAAGSCTPVTVNVSGLQLNVPGVVGRIADLLAVTGVEPSGLTFEVTESAVMGDVDRVVGVFDGLHGLGVALALDDFGTGHSSLSRLALLPFDYVKIDRSFIARSRDEARASILVEAIASLCQTLGLTAVAEGVETGEQLEAVRRLGIPFAQGYLLGRPVPAGDLPAGPAAPASGPAWRGVPSAACTEADRSGVWWRGRPRRRWPR
jgi:diguanylate cyclase (GGDEF)-like protein/PAS domain S-box-containing protein